MSAAKRSVICPRCGCLARLSQGKFGLKAECCGMWSWNGKPLETRATHAARIEAHRAFDRVWASGPISRGEAYRRLALEMGVTQDRCHIAHMSVEEARRVVEIASSGRLLDAKYDRASADA